MPTLRSLARSLGLSTAAVSNALNDHGRIAPETRLRVKRAARAAGYRHNPLAASLMGELRRSRGDRFRGVLASVEVVEPERPAHSAAFHRELLHGATERAATLGFKFANFVLGQEELTVARLDNVLQARGIHGLLILPAWREPDWSQLDWSRYAGVYTDYNTGTPTLHCVCCNHYRSMMVGLARLVERGYRRPGLFLERNRNARIHHRWGAGFYAFQQNHPDVEAAPTLYFDTLDRAEFCRWFREHQPDVVISHHPETIDWMESCGARVPETHGFACINLLHESPTRSCAGLDLQPSELGARSVEMLIAQLQRNERGIPEWPTTTTIPARWADGPTLRPVFA